MNILTFDIEEWFHCDFISQENNWDSYEVRIFKNTERILEALSAKKQKATFFCLGWIARKYPNILLQIKSQGHEIGCHSNMHELVYRQDYNEFKMDTKIAIEAIENVIGEKVQIFRAPAFSITENVKWAFEVLSELGIQYDSSVFPTSRDYGGFPSEFKTFSIVCQKFIMLNGSYSFTILTSGSFGEMYTSQTWK